GLQRTLQRDAGYELLPLPALDGRPAAAALLDELGRRRMTNVLVEGGPTVLGNFLDAQLTDEVQVYVAPFLVGGEDARTAVGGLGVEKIAQAARLTDWSVEVL